ncbi:sodium transporter [Duganella sp. BJB488]|uniref:sodium:solute symporter family transporter n=2 Tax=unclassified Duganella TaxID=2636909 RepID=UPI000E34717D|nr:MULTISPECIES: sodium/solute symporter [unclassified Duganella]NVD73731.1 sodium/solute symporter [Duganella sp. BJB1802]RFP17833.1 sodium transporter [Duganella sp. BJB489]RFP22340.1 sodium transporter [Duganella sp. BJB488]RFP37674.1 sodium transporter [Duganella sp. BJB480]
MNTFSALDTIVFLVYFVMVAGYGLWVYRRKQAGSGLASHDYFLAEGSLTWWAIGASLIASNISAEQFIGMSGSGFRIGMAVAVYELMAAATLVIVAVFFMPVYLKNRIYTMPQFLEQRYGKAVATTMALFWLGLYVVVNLTSILYLGALAISSLSGIALLPCMLFLAVFAAIITLGGMKVIGYTDVVQVTCLVVGGLVTTWLALDMVAALGNKHGALQGFSELYNHARGHFDMVLKRDNPNYMDLPGLSVLLGGMWIVNLNYWGCNQYITQRALGADLPTARKGLLFAAFLKLLMPVIVVLPGIAAYALDKSGALGDAMKVGGEVNPDRAYPILLGLLPSGLKGIAFAALTAAVVASLAGKANSIATIFTLDIYKKAFNKGATEQRMVWIGRVSVVVAMALAVLIAPMLGIDKKGGFQYIQEYTGFVSPGILAMFLLGFFWKKTTSGAAMFATLGGLAGSIVLKFLPTMMDLSFLAPIGFSKDNGSGVFEIPFLDRMFIVFWFVVAGMVVISKMAEARRDANTRHLQIDHGLFRVDGAFAFGSAVICVLLATIYTAWW